MIKYPILYINLNKSIDRKLFQEKQKKIYNLNLTKITAVSFEEIKEIQKGVIQGIPYKVDKNKLPNNKQLACILSHIKCLLYFKNSNYDKIIIMEDDISLELINKWKNNLCDIIHKAPKSWECIKIDNCNPKMVKSNIQKFKNGVNFLTNIKNNKVSTYHVLRNYSAGFYILNRKYLNSFFKKYYIENSFYLWNETDYIVSETLLFSLPKCYDYTEPLVFSHGFERNIIEKKDEGKDIKVNIHEVNSRKIILNYYQEHL